MEAKYFWQKLRSFGERAQVEDTIMQIGEVEVFGDA